MLTAAITTTTSKSPAVHPLKSVIETLWDDGNKFIHEAKYEQALATFQALEKHTPKDLHTLSNIAFTHLRLGDYLAAIQYCDRILKESPKNTLALDNKGAALMMLGQYAEAEQYFQAAFKEDPNDLTVIADRGFSHFFAGHDEEATQLFLLVHASSPELETAHRYAKLGLGLLAYKQDKTDNVVYYLFEQAEKDCTPDELHELLLLKALGFSTLGQHQLAMKSMQDLLSRFPHSKSALLQKDKIQKKATTASRTATESKALVPSTALVKASGLIDHAPLTFFQSADSKLSDPEPLSTTKDIMLDLARRRIGVDRYVRQLKAAEDILDEQMAQLIAKKPAPTIAETPQFAPGDSKAAAHEVTVIVKESSEIKSVAVPSARGVISSTALIMQPERGDSKAIITPEKIDPSLPSQSYRKKLAIAEFRSRLYKTSILGLIDEIHHMDRSSSHLARYYASLTEEYKQNYLNTLTSNSSEQTLLLRENAQVKAEYLKLNIYYQALASNNKRLAHRVSKLTADHAAKLKEIEQANRSLTAATRQLRILEQEHKTVVESWSLPVDKIRLLKMALEEKNEELKNIKATLNFKRALEERNEELKNDKAAIHLQPATLASKIMLKEDVDHILSDNQLEMRYQIERREAKLVAMEMYLKKQSKAFEQELAHIKQESNLFREERDRFKKVCEEFSTPQLELGIFATSHALPVNEAQVAASPPESPLKPGQTQ